MKRKNTVNPKNRQIVISRHKQTCAKCGREGEEIHHLFEVWRGGCDHPNNLIYLCHQCHRGIPFPAKEWSRYLKTNVEIEIQLFYKHLIETRLFGLHLSNENPKTDKILKAHKTSYNYCKELRKSKYPFFKDILKNDANKGELIRGLFK